jgi:F-type H+-transporting ATPase subunit delta
MAEFAARYARALADVVEDRKLGVGQVQQQLEDFALTFAGSKDLQEVLLNPTLPVKKRVSILDAVNRKIGVGPKVRNFIAVLIEHERLDALNEILEEYRLEIARRLGISEVEVTTARPLHEEERAELESQVMGLAGTEIRATFLEDPSLIGGAIVRIGSKVYDGSIRGRLERLKDQLVAT